MKKYFKYSLFVVIVFTLTLTTNSCEDWTELESVNLNNPTIEDVNPQLYEDYLKNLKAYKKRNHKAVIVSFDNPATSPAKQAERLTAIPDSVDFVCLNNPKDLSSVTKEEMVKIRTDKGTRTIYSINYDSFEAIWDEKAKENPELTEEDALKYLEEQVDALIALCDQHQYDGILVDYTGRSLVSLTEPKLEQYNARQQVLLNKIKTWKESNKEKALIFYGNVQYLVPQNMNVLAMCNYIIIRSASSPNGDDLSLKAYLAVQAGIDVIPEEGGESPVPTDRFLACVELPQADDKDEIIGYWSTVTGGDKLLAAHGAAQWVMKESPDFARSGLYILNIQNDYYNDTYGNVRDVIRIMNPNK